MRYETVQFDREEQYREMFLQLPGMLYLPGELMQNMGEERKILDGTHPLSRYFTVYKFLTLDLRTGNAAARAVLTLYPEDGHGYIGYFESMEDSSGESAAASLFQSVSAWAKEQGCEKLTGPVNTSFWTGYRLKVDRFGDPYTGEPYNREYYQALFKKAGFQVTEVYKSNRFGVIRTDFDDPKFASRLEEKRAAGYEIRSPKRKEFDAVLRQCYRLIIRLYRDFPVFKYIDEDAFADNYSYLKYVIDLRMIKTAWYQGEMKGFFISIPNYGNSFCGAFSPAKLGKILRQRFFPKDYVMLYMGVDEAHHGLGKALSEEIMRELKRRKAASVGALIHGDKVNGGYFKELIEYEYHYVLMEMDLE